MSNAYWFVYQRFLIRISFLWRVIEVQDVVKVYRGGNGTRALDGVSFEVPSGGIFGFLGPNGAGKTTTIRILGTILEPTEGTVRIGGADLREEPLRIKSRLGLMPDEVAFFPTLTGMDHLVYYASFYRISRPEARCRARELLDELAMGDAASKKVRSYSHGMKKRLAIAQCLMHDPDVLIMDEPANGLDPEGMRFFRDLLRSLHASGKTIFLSSHLLHEVEQLCDRVGIINHGCMMAVDSISNLAAGPASNLPDLIHVSADGLTDSAVEAILAIPGVTRAQVTPKGMDVSLAPGSEATSEITKALVLAGVRIREVRKEQPSLEDLFLAITKGARS